MLIFSQIFNGNTDRHSVVYHQFVRPFKAIYVRIYPRTWYGWISMRAELYGCSGKNAIAPPILLVSWSWYAHGIGHKASINLGDPGTVSRQGREERRDKRFQARAEKPLGIETQNTMSKRSSKWWLLIEQKNALYYCAQSANSISWVLLQFQNEACLWNLFIWRKHA